jgi:hypothetical protein
LSRNIAFWLDIIVLSRKIIRPDFTNDLIQSDYRSRVSLIICYMRKLRWITSRFYWWDSASNGHKLLGISITDSDGSFMIFLYIHKLWYLIHSQYSTSLCCHSYFAWFQTLSFGMLRYSDNWKCVPLSA